MIKSDMIAPCGLDCALRRLQWMQQDVWEPDEVQRLMSQKTVLSG